MKPLPAEIIWLIIDAAVEDLDAQFYGDVFQWAVPRQSYTHERRQRLCVACALTSKVILPRARFHLYRSITLYHRFQVPSLARTMAECDDLALIVKQLTFWLAEFVVEDDDQLFDMPFPSHVVARLSNLLSLKIGGYGSTYGSSPMPPAALDFAKLFAAACPSLQELSLTELHFNSFADFIDVLWSFPHIRKVTISHLFWRHRIFDVSDNEEQDDPTRLPTTLRRSNNLTSVAIGVCVSATDMSARVWGANVKTLILQSVPFDDDRDLSSFMHLEQLEVHHFPDAVHVLRKIRSEHLRIVEVHGTVEEQWYERLLADFTEIDGILSQPMFHSLRRISLTMVYRHYYYKRQDDARWVEDVTACFPGLQGRGILHVIARSK